VGGLVLNAEGKIFLAKSPKWNNKWIIPCGHIEHGECAEEALVREVREETGLLVKPLHMLAVKDCIHPENYHKPEKHFVMINYLCKVVGGEEKLDGRELVESVWIDAESSLETLDVEEYSAVSIETYIKIIKFSDEVARGVKYGQA
jgi:nucleoside triphosphatase